MLILQINYFGTLRCADTDANSFHKTIANQQRSILKSILKICVNGGIGKEIDAGPIVPHIVRLINVILGESHLPGQ